MPLRQLADSSILLVDDHVIVRQGCRDLLVRAGARRIEEATDGEDAYRRYVEHPADVVVMDLSMARLSGLDTIQRITRRDPAARIVVFSMHDEPMFVLRALRAGAQCYVTKTSPPDELVVAIRTALKGGRHLSHDVAQALAMSGALTRENPLGVLTAREFEICRLVSLGRTNAQIGELLSISAKSVSNAVGRIREKLGVESTSELVRLAVGQELFKE
ncbi:MAG: response regulator [Gammaproteobacteria bacterium]